MLKKGSPHSVRMVLQKSPTTGILFLTRINRKKEWRLVMGRRIVGL
jgi:hypothetical protein